MNRYFCKLFGNISSFRSKAYISSQEWSKNQAFGGKKFLILTKLSRYDFEVHKNPGLSDLQLKHVLAKRGSDYQMLRHRHNKHKVSFT